MTRFTRVALRDPCGVSTIPLTKLFSGAPHNLLAGFDRGTATKLSRRWQPPRVTSTTGMQHEHLVSLDAISQCNALESLTSLLIRTLASTSELEGSQAHLHKPSRLKGAQLAGQAQPPLLFIAHKRIEPLYPFTGLSTYAPDVL